MLGVQRGGADALPRRRGSPRPHSHRAAAATAGGGGGASEERLGGKAACHVDAGRSLLYLQEADVSPTQAVPWAAGSGNIGQLAAAAAEASSSTWGTTLRFHGAGAAQSRMAALSTLSTEQVRDQLRQPYATSPLRPYVLALLSLLRCTHLCLCGRLLAAGRYRSAIHDVDTHAVVTPRAGRSTPADSPTVSQDNEVVQSVAATLKPEISRAADAFMADLFNRIVRDQDGNVTRAEMIKAVRADADARLVLGLPTIIGENQRAQLEEVYQGLGASDHDRTIEFDEFVLFMEGRTE
eukprot:COSAG02_NODE_16424_length_1084_cov_1.767513_1_plen_294_part_10